MPPVSQQEVESLTEEAINLGATSAALILSRHIQVKDDLAQLCNGDYTCPNYGLAASCPPHVEGPIEFRKWQARSEYSITLKIELPISVMFSDERKGVMQMLHHIVATVEQKAIAMGFKESRGFAGGSCKELFCKDFKTCSVIDEGKACRHQESARPSMSGFGIDTVSLMKSSGWPAQIAENPQTSESVSTSWVAGLVLLA